MRKSVLLFVLMIAGSLNAQSITPDTYGTVANTYLTLQAWDFRPIDTSVTSAFNTAPWGFSRTNAGGVGWFVAPVHLPAGASWTGLEIQGCDFDLTSTIEFWLDTQFKNGFNNSNLIGTLAPLSNCSITTLPWTPFTVDNANAYYFIRANFQITGTNLILSAARVSYKLQVSAAPVAATFSDVPTSHQFFQFIEALAASGITTGCAASPPRYCPDSPVTRGQMAVFLSKALGLHFAP